VRGRGRDAYEVLGVPRDATDHELKRAYRELAHRFHPDKNPGDVLAEERFKEIAIAYGVLSDPEQRARHDRLGDVEREGVWAEVVSDFAGTVQEVWDGLLADLLGRRGRQNGRDLRYTLDLGFEEAALGARRRITYPARATCPRCRGGGAAAGATSTRLCDPCDGRGWVRMERAGFSLRRQCPDCRGVGRRVVVPCPDCKGEGSFRVERQLEVTLPAGVPSGHVKLIRGEGEHGRLGGKAGDLYLMVRVAEHPLLRREGDEVACDLKLTIPMAVLGGMLEVPTLTGKVKMRVPPGTTSGKLFRLRGLGLLRKSGERGDQKVRVTVDIPTLLSAREKELYEELARLAGQEVGEVAPREPRGLFGRVVRQLLR